MIHHRVDDSGGADELALERTALDFERHLLGKISLRHRADHAGDFCRGLNQVGDETVDGLDTRGPLPGTRGERGPLPDPAFLADRRADPRELIGHVFIELENIVQDVGDLARQPDLIYGHADREVPFLEGDQGGQYLIRI